MKRVAVTGLGLITPLGKTTAENWDSLMKGRSGIVPTTLFDCREYTSRIAGEVPGYRSEDYFSVKDLKRIDRFIELAMVASDEAVKSSGLDFAKENMERIGTSIGVGLGGLYEIQRQYKEILEKGARRISPFFIPAVISNLAAGHVSMRHGLKGPNTCITTACSSSAHSFGESFRLIQRGFADVMFAGGAESTICEMGVGGFCAMRALSERNDEPTKASRPFDKDRDGFVMGEGSGVVVLEEWDRAKKRGANIFAEVIGYGLNADAYHLTAPSPGGEGAARCMRLALEDAGINPSDVDYVNAHGTSTPVGDELETTALKTVFGSHAKDFAVSSTKSMTGHLLGAAGAVEAAYCVLAIQGQVVPPTINLDNPSPGCDLNYVPHEPQKRKVRIALSNSFGFGGTNASLVLRQPA